MAEECSGRGTIAFSLSVCRSIVFSGAGQAKDGDAKTGAVAGRPGGRSSAAKRSVLGREDVDPGSRIGLGWAISCSGRSRVAVQ
jgi:hypothetical protein